MLLYSNNWRKPPPPPLFASSEGVTDKFRIRQLHPGILLENYGVPSENVQSQFFAKGLAFPIQVENYGASGENVQSNFFVNGFGTAIQVENYGVSGENVQSRFFVQQNTTAFLLALDAEGSADAFAFSPYEHSPDRFLEVLTPLLEANTQTLQMQPFVANPSLTY